MVVVQTGKYGRLGNRLILSAHLLAFAKEYRHWFVDFGFDEYAIFFSSSSNRPFLSWPQFPLGFPFAEKAQTISFTLSRHVTVGGRANRIFGKYEWFEQIYLKSLAEEANLDLESNRELVKRLINSKIVVCDGWWIRSHNLVQKHSSFIIDFFRPNLAIQREVYDRIEKLRQGTDYLVGVHVRREDYRVVAPHLVFEDSTWKKILFRIKEMLHPCTVKFVVCSNESLNWMNTNDLDYVIVKGEPVVDLHILAACDYIVGPPSTFSEWAAFVGRSKLCVLRSEQIGEIDSFIPITSPEGTRL